MPYKKQDMIPYLLLEAYLFLFYSFCHVKNEFVFGSIYFAFAKFDMLRFAQREKTQQAPISNNLDTFDRLRKYKQLCDEGIITQEEFEAKKKQLMNL